MRIWIKIIAKFCFVSFILLSIASCDGFCESCFGDGCTTSDGTSIPVAPNAIVFTNPDAVVEGDSVQFSLAINDTLIGFSFGFQIGAYDQDCSAYSGTTHANFSESGDTSHESASYCLVSGNTYAWKTPLVKTDSLLEKKIVVLHDSLFSVGAFNRGDCGNWDYYGPTYITSSFLLLDRNSPLAKSNQKR